MQSSDQSPEEKQPPFSQPSANSDHTLESHSNAPSPQARNEQGSLNGDAHGDASGAVNNNDARRQGQSDPPLPSFYERELAKSAAPTPPVAHPAPEPAARPSEPLDSGPQSGYAAPYPPATTPGGYMPPPGYPAYPQGFHYPGTLPPPFVAGPPPARQSRKWLWILLSVLVVIVIGSCGLCAWASSSLISRPFSAAFGSTQLITDYYSALQNKQYTQAYSYLSPQGSLTGLTSDQFVSQATQRDELYGPVLRYTPSQPQVGSYSDNLDSISMNVMVSRQKKSYTTHLQLKLINNQWKIVSYDQL